MKTKITIKSMLFIILIPAILSCNNNYSTEKGNPSRYLVNCCDSLQSIRYEQAVLQCIEKGNNMSEEEMEDVIVQCKRTFHHIICKDICIKYWLKTSNYVILPCNRVSDKEGREMCTEICKQ